MQHNENSVYDFGRWQDGYPATVPVVIITRLEYGPGRRRRCFQAYLGRPSRCHSRYRQKITNERNGPWEAIAEQQTGAAHARAPPWRVDAKCQVMGASRRFQRPLCVSWHLCPPDSPAHSKRRPPQNSPRPAHPHVATSLGRGPPSLTKQVCSARTTPSRPTTACPILHLSFQPPPCSLPEQAQPGRACDNATRHRVSQGRFIGSNGAAIFWTRRQQRAWYRISLRGRPLALGPRRRIWSCRMHGSTPAGASSRLPWR